MAMYPAAGSKSGALSYIRRICYCHLKDQKVVIQYSRIGGREEGLVKPPFT